MKKKVYSAPKSLYMEVSTESLMTLSVTGQSTNGAETQTDVIFETKESNDNVWDNIW